MNKGGMQSSQPSALFCKCGKETTYLNIGGKKIE